jgi:hypothetical protein
MAEIESAHFYLTNQMATTDILGSTLIFRGFDLKECLGDLFNKYDKFKIVLNSVVNWNNNTSVPNRNVMIKMSGLDFLGVMDYKTNDKTIATLGIILAGQNGGVTSQLPANWGCVFNKPSYGSVDLSIFYYNVITNSMTNTNYLHSQFFFSIYGVK